MRGPGKYGDVAEKVAELTEASELLVIVLDGNKGPGFTCSVSQEHMHMIPEILRITADSIEKDIRQMGQSN